MDASLITPEFLYPIAIWPVLMSSILYTLFRYNKALENQGIEVLSLYKGIGMIFLIFFPLATVADTAIHIYMFYKMGWKYLWCLPIIVFMMFALFFIVGVTPFAQFVYPIIYIFLGLAFLDLINVINWKFLGSFNMLVLDSLWYKPFMARGG